MAFMLSNCGVADCGRPLYVEVKEGEQTVICGKCHGATLYTFKPSDEPPTDEADA